MISFYFGPHNEYIEAGYATSNRSTCKSCKLKIQKEAVRLAYVIDANNLHSRHWYHLRCFELKPLFKDINIEEQVYNLDQVDYHYDQVYDYLQEEVNRLKQGRRKHKPQYPPSSSEPKNHSDQNLSSQNIDHNRDQDEQQIQQNTGRKMHKKQSQQQVQIKQQPSIAVDTYDQHQKYQELLDIYLKSGFEKLKAELSINNQPKNGNKRELAERCVDGVMLGKIPQCPQCGGGKPRFNRATRTYRCPGYMEDDIFQSCNRIFHFNQIQRLPWATL